MFSRNTANRRPLIWQTFVGNYRRPGSWRQSKSQNASTKSDRPRASGTRKSFSLAKSFVPVDRSTNELYAKASGGSGSHSRAVGRRRDRADRRTVGADKGIRGSTIFSRCGRKRRQLFARSE